MAETARERGGSGGNMVERERERERERGRRRRRRRRRRRNRISSEGGNEERESS